MKYKRKPVSAYASPRGSRLKTRRRRMRKIMTVRWGKEIVAEVYTEDNQNFYVRRHVDHPIKQPFHSSNITYAELMNILKSRCWEKERADIPYIMKELGIKNYNPYDIVKKTKGKSYNDPMWFDIHEDLNKVREVALVHS